MKSVLFAGVALLGVAGVADAANVVTFSQTSGANTLTATVNGAQTQTTLTIDDAAISIGQLIAGAPPATVFVSLNAVSNDAAVPILGAVIQHFDGHFCVSSAINCGGVNVLSGVFSDAAFGALSGPGLTVNVNNPPDTLTLASDIIPASDLASPNAMSLGFTNLVPGLHISGTTIGPFSASFAGTVSASVVEVPEPFSIVLLGVGLLGLSAARRQRRG